MLGGFALKQNRFNNHPFQTSLTAKNTGFLGWPRGMYAPSKCRKSKNNSPKTNVEIELDDSQKKDLFSGSTTIFARVRFVFTMRSIRYSTKSMNLKGKHHDLHPKTLIDCHFTIKHRQQINRTNPFINSKYQNMSRCVIPNFQPSTSASGNVHVGHYLLPVSPTRSSSNPLEMVNWVHVVFKDTSTMLVS